FPFPCVLLCPARSSFEAQSDEGLHGLYLFPLHASRRCIWCLVAVSIVLRGTRYYVVLPVVRCDTRSEECSGCGGALFSPGNPSSQHAVNTAYCTACSCAGDIRWTSGIAASPTDVESRESRASDSFYDSPPPPPQTS
ncbi:unnamed protein product, partial [Sphacelaria rigidula]